jgi:multisubunit Na+/H+ antiporter MnhF subunit
MTLWNLAALAMLAIFALGYWAAMRGQDTMRLVGLQFCSVIGGVVLLLLSLQQGSASFMDLAIAVALLSTAGTLTYAHFIERFL